MLYELGKLPAELWLSVADFSTQNSLHNLCLVSKGFHALMEPKLWQQYVQPGFPDQSSLRSFIRACLARPDLAGKVRKATVHDVETWNVDGYKSIRKRCKTAKSEWRRKYDLEIKHLRSEIWPGPLITHHGFETQNLALLCLLLPNIEHLILGLSRMLWGMIPVFNGIRTYWKLATPFLSQLRYLHLDFTHEKDGVHLDKLRPLIALSALETIQGHNINERSYSKYEFPEPLSMPRELSIQHINLMCSVITHSLLRELIEGCHTLKTFKLVYGERSTGPIYDFDVLSSAFLAHKASLESLTLDFKGEKATESLEDDDISGVMTLSSFECLRHIDIPAWGMLRVNQNDDDGDGKSDSTSISKLLPLSLESLVVRSCDENTVAPLWGLLSTLDSFPNLKEIAFTGKREANLQGLDGFEDACKEKRIGLNSEK